MNTLANSLRSTCGAGALLGALAAGCATNTEVPTPAIASKEFQVSFENPSPERIELRFHRGLVIAESGDRLHCDVLVDIVGHGLADLLDQTREISAKVVESDLVTSIALQHPMGAPLDAVHVRYHLQVPPETMLLIETKEGRVCLRGLKNRVQVTTESGPIEARMEGGNAQLTTTSGTIRLSGDYSVAQVSSLRGRLEASLPTETAVELCVDSPHGQVFIDVPDNQSLALAYTGLRTDVHSQIPMEWHVQESEGTHAGRVGNRNGATSTALSVRQDGGTLTFRRLRVGIVPQ